MMDGRILLFFRAFPPCVLLALTGCSDGDDGSGAPTITELVEGNDQSAVVDGRVPIPPRMRVTDSRGNPVPDLEVTFSVTEGGGRLEGAVARTGEDGSAAPEAWVLGPTPGENGVVGEMPGLAPIFFVATGLPDDRGSFVIDAGNDQSARLGAALAEPPSVQRLTQEGVPMPGEAVMFSIGEGGGSIERTEASTDDEGRATPGVWRLGDVAGPQTLVATTPGMPPLTFRATAVSGDAPVLRQTPWITDITRPWDLAFLPDGTMLITERGGRVWSVAPGSQDGRVILERPDDLQVNGQSGLLGIAIDPEFEDNRFVYTYLASNRGGATDNRVRRWRLSADGGGLVEDRDILTGITWDADGAHSGGRIRFGPEGYLWITSGDVRSATVPQDVQELGGKVLRVTREGAPAPGNPDLGGGARPEIYFVGVRNPQGLAFRPGSGAAFICEHGPDNDDEVTALVAGGNGGWNPNDGNGNYNGYSGALMSDPAIPGVISPSYRLEVSEGMSGCDFLVGPQWLAWDGALLIGLLAGERALALPLDAAGTAPAGEAEPTLDTGARLRSIVQGPDGYVYVAVDADSGTIWRVSAD